MSSGGNSVEAFAVAVGFTASEAVLAVKGEVDLVSAPELAALAGAVIERGHQTVVLDLTDCGFMGAAGLGVIADCAGRLGPREGRLIVRSPSGVVVRMLDITGLGGLVTVEHPGFGSDHLGPEQSSAAPGVPVTVEPADLAQRLRLVTAVPADDDVVDGALRLVVALAQATVGGADGVSVSLRRHGRLTTVAASDQTISDMDAEQYATGEGPCVDASIKGHWFHVESLDQETRWPAFTPKAQKLGISAILSTPLLAGAEPVGALNIYSTTTGAFAAKEQELASIFATEASVILRDASVDVSDDQLSRRLQEALRARQKIAFAQGVLMERHGVSEHEAYTQLRDFSRTADLPLVERAADVVASSQRAPRG